jgi:ubiquitin-protein ligase E3 C
VRFINEFGIDEVGIDGGGITKEFIMRVISQAFDPQLGLFLECRERTMIPNPYYFYEDLK